MAEIVFNEILWNLYNVLCAKNLGAGTLYSKEFVQSALSYLWLYPATSEQRKTAWKGHSNQIQPNPA